MKGRVNPRWKRSVALYRYAVRLQSRGQTGPGLIGGILRMKRGKGRPRKYWSDAELLAMVAEIKQEEGLRSYRAAANVLAEAMFDDPIKQGWARRTLVNTL